MSEHNVVSSWEPMIPSLLLMSFARVSPPTSVTTEGNWSSRDCSQTTSRSGRPRGVGVEGDASLSPIPCASGGDRSNMVSSTSCSRSRFHMGRSFSTLHSISFWPFWESRSSPPVGHEDQCKIFPTTVPTGIFHQMYPWASAKLLDVDLRWRVWDNNAIGGLNIQNFAWMSKNLLLFMNRRRKTHYM